MFNSENRQRLTIKTIKAPQSGHRTASPDNAEVTAKANGVVPVTAQLMTESGRPIGRPFDRSAGDPERHDRLGDRHCRRHRSGGQHIPAHSPGGQGAAKAASGEPAEPSQATRRASGSASRAELRAGRETRCLNLDTEGEPTRSDRDEPSTEERRHTRRLVSASALMAAGPQPPGAGLFQLMLLVYLFGNGTRQAEMFTIATTVPNSMYILLAGGVLNTVLVPQIVRLFGVTPTAVRRTPTGS